jgi:GTPase SAR1 family protein
LESLGKPKVKKSGFYKNNVFLLFSYDQWMNIESKSGVFGGIFGGRKRKRIKLKIHDTAGQEEMTSLFESHLKNKDTGMNI